MKISFRLNLFCLKTVDNQLKTYSLYGLSKKVYLPVKLYPADLNFGYYHQIQILYNHAQNDPADTIFYTIYNIYRIVQLYNIVELSFYLLIQQYYSYDFSFLLFR